MIRAFLSAAQGKRYSAGAVCAYKRSIFAARMKSLSVSPCTECVQMVIATLPHVRRMSG